MRRKKGVVCLLLALTLVGTPIQSRAETTDADRQAMFSALRTCGLSDAAAAGLMGNVYGESAYNPRTLEASARNGIGMFQWTDNAGKEPAQLHFQSAEHANHEKYTFTNTVCGDLTGTRSYTLCAEKPCQIAYGVNFTKAKLSVNSKWASRYNEVVGSLSVFKTAVGEGKIPKTITPAYPFENWAKLDNLESATIQAYLDVFTASATRPFWINSKGEHISGYSTSDSYTTKFVTEYNKRFGEAKKVYELCKGKYEAGESMGADSTMKEELAVAFKAEWSDEQLASYCKLTETNMDDVLKEAKRENLSAEHQHSLADWEANVESNDNWFLWGIRHLCIFIGICMIVWAIIIYVCYWFDRLNTFTDYSAVALLSIGKLRLSDTEQECTYFERGKQKFRTVNNRAMLTVCILAIVCGTLITSGTLYKVMLWTVLMAKEFLNK